MKRIRNLLSAKKGFSMDKESNKYMKRFRDGFSTVELMVVLEIT